MALKRTLSAPSPRCRLRNACSRTDCPYRPCNGDTDLPELNSDPSLRQQNIKDRYYGINDPVAEKILRRAEDMPKLSAPEDTSICTLFVGGLDERVDEESLKDAFYAYGELQSIRVVPGKSCAFVTYTMRDAAEKAAEALSNSLVVKVRDSSVPFWMPFLALRAPSLAPAFPCVQRGKSVGLLMLRFF